MVPHGAARENRVKLGTTSIFCAPSGIVYTMTYTEEIRTVVVTP